DVARLLGATENDVLLGARSNEHDIVAMSSAGRLRNYRVLHSGLARAFFYAGARALLVSHWYVNSDATVALIKGAFEELKADLRIGRAEALRRSMLALVDTGPERFAHPAAWAPFVVVGEGGSAR